MRGSSLQRPVENEGQNNEHSEEPYITTTLKVALHCEGCKRKVVDALCKVKGVQKIDISMKKQRVIVCGHVDPWRILKVIKRTGKSVNFWSPRDTPEVDLVPPDAGKGSHSEDVQQPSGDTCTCINSNQEKGRDEVSVEDCPVEPIAAATRAISSRVPVSFNNLKMNSTYVDAKYIDPKSERLPFTIRATETPVSLVGANSYRDVMEVKQLNSSVALGEEQSLRSNRKLTRRTVNLDEFVSSDGHLPPRPAERTCRPHLTYAGAHPKLLPTQAPGDKHMPTSKVSRNDSYNVHSRTVSLPHTRKQTSHDDSDVESEELFAVLKTKKGIQFLSMDPSKMLQNSIKISPNYSDSELRRHSRITKKHISAIADEERSNKKATVTCESCRKIKSRLYSADVDWARQHLSAGSPRSLGNSGHRGTHQASHSSPDYRSAEQYPSEELEDEDEEDQDQDQDEQEEEEEEEKLETRPTHHRERSGYALRSRRNLII